MPAPDHDSPAEPSDEAEIGRAIARALKVWEVGSTVLTTVAELAGVSAKLSEDVEWTMRVAARRLRKLLGANG